MKRLIVFLFVTITLAVNAQTDTSIVKFVNPSSLSLPRGYSHAAVIDLGNGYMIILSGQVPLDKQGNLVGKEDFDKQTEQVFVNIKNAVSELGGTMDNIVKLGYFVTDLSHIQQLRAIRDKYVNTKNPPASTLVQVSKLFRDDVFLEVEATAFIPKRK